MIKAYILLSKRSDINNKEFSRHWLEVHAPLALRLKALRRYVQSHLLADAVPEFVQNQDLSGFAEVWMDSLQDLQGIPTDPDYLQGLYLDEPNFLDREQTRYLFTREYEVVPPPKLPDGPPGLIKSVYLTRRLPGMSVDEFQRHWREIHAPLIPKTPGLLGYTQSHILPECYEDEPPCYDGVAELWWPDIETFTRAWNSEQHKNEQLNDLVKFVDMENTVGMLVRPHHIL